MKYIRLENPKEIKKADIIICLAAHHRRPAVRVLAAREEEPLQEALVVHRERVALLDGVEGRVRRGKTEQVPGEQLELPLKKSLGNS